MLRKEDFYIGQEVGIRSIYNSSKIIRKARIEKIGRKYVTADNCRFLLDCEPGYKDCLRSDNRMYLLYGSVEEAERTIQKEHLVLEISKLSSVGKLEQLSLERLQYLEEILSGEYPDSDWTPVESGEYPKEKQIVQVTYLGYYDKMPRCDAFAYREKDEWHWAMDDSCCMVDIVAWRFNDKPYFPEKGPSK